MTTMRDLLKDFANDAIKFGSDEMKLWDQPINKDDVDEKVEEMVDLFMLRVKRFFD
jgi:hypothetical protein